MVGPLLALILQSSALPSGGWSLPATRACSADEIGELTAAPNAADTPYRLTCRAELNGRAILRRILIEGAEASGAGIDCGGGSIGRPGARTTTQTPTIAVWSRRIDGPSPAWSRPTDIAVSRCTIHGAIRIWGMGVGGRIDDVRTSSRTAGHTAAAQAAGPSNVTLTALTFASTGSIPLYVGPGVTRVTVNGGRFTGRSDSTAIYLDAESAGNVIRDVTFDLTTPREKIAVDGSARNTITGNRFALGGQGGVFLYRNCGEDGVIRHQTPSGNVVSDNVFTGASLLRSRTVVVGAREGGRRYCGEDRGWPFGSSLDDGDHATGNTVARNRTSR
jgi:hypothetical protein